MSSEQQEREALDAMAREYTLVIDRGLELLANSFEATPQPAQVAEPVRPAAEASYERMRHIANEWADMAINGWQWAQNIKDGISTAEDACANLEQNLRHCREVNDAPQQAQGSEPEATPATPQQMAQVDAALGLRGLPTIRLAGEVVDALTAQASAKGVILQAHVREILQVAAQGSESEAVAIVQETAAYWKARALAAEAKQGSESGEAVDPIKRITELDAMIRAEAANFCNPDTSDIDPELLVHAQAALWRLHEARAANDQRDAARWRLFSNRIDGMRNWPERDQWQEIYDAATAYIAAQAPGGAA